MGLSCSSTRIQQLLKINDDKTKHCIYEAIRHCDGLSLARHLLSRTDINIYNAWGLSPLHIASEIGDENLVQILFSMGADVNLATCPSQGGVPPLVFAATNGHTAVVRMLLEAGASVDATDDWGCTALFKAATYNHIDCVKEMLKFGADPNKANRWGAIPLQYAAHQGHYKVIQLLVENGNCDMHMQGEESVAPPLVVAAMRGYYQCVSALLDAGTDVNVSHNGNGETALLHAIKYCQHALNDFTDSSTATINDRMQCIELLLKAGATVSAATVKQLCMEDYFLHFACEATQRSEVKLIKIILRSFPCRRLQEDMDAFRKLHREVVVTKAVNIPLLNELTWLMCSVGLNLTNEDVDNIAYTLSNAELAKVKKFQKAPRSLMDNCRLALRASMEGNGNVLARADQLPLPKALKDFVTLENPNHYSL